MEKMKAIRANHQSTCTVVLLLSCALTSPSFAFHVGENSGPVSISTSDSAQQACETGAGGRAQIELDGGAIVRLGANGLLRSTGEDRPAALSRGTALFDLGKQSQPILLQHAGKELVVKRGVGFVRYSENQADKSPVLLIGALAGKVSIVAGARSRSLQAGEMLILDKDGQAVIHNFDLPKLTKSSVLLTAFRSPLPAQLAIQREEAKFLSLQSRGFIRTDPSVALAEGVPSSAASGSPALSASSVSLLAGGAVVVPVSESALKPSQHQGNTGLGNGLDPQPPGNTPINGGPGTGPGNPGNKGGSPGHPHP